MRINRVIKTYQWRCAPQICPAPHFVVSHLWVIEPICVVSAVKCQPENQSPIQHPSSTYLTVYIFYSSYIQLTSIYVGSLNYDGYFKQRDRAIQGSRQSSFQDPNPFLLVLGMMQIQTCLFPLCSPPRDVQARVQLAVKMSCAW